ncbi:hypothetical protein Btru_049758 [Bulinus truncatus]|nr:hypothetical protein Btru_049758 [Bulinus truncatus]
MSLQPQDKVNMSLDEIIKISKSEKIKQAKQIKKGRVFFRGQGYQRGRGRGRGIEKNVNSQGHIKTNSESLGRGRGRGRGAFQQHNVNPLERKGTRQFRGRGRGTNLNVQHQQKIFTNNQKASSNFVGQQSLHKKNDAKKQAALLREKQLALKNLQLAKQNVQNVNLALQKSSRDLIINQKRGLNNITTSNRGGRGRSKLNTQPIRQLVNTSVTVINPSVSNSNSSFRGKNRRGRGNLNKQRSEHFTILVSNEQLQPNKQESVSIVDQLKLLKPAVPTAYKFQKNMFAAPATGLSLNERFSSSTLSEGGDGFNDGRKVFL